MLKFILKIIFTGIIVLVLKQTYFNYAFTEYDDTVDIEFDGGDYYDEDDNGEFAYDDYDTESDW